MPYLLVLMLALVAALPSADATLAAERPAAAMPAQKCYSPRETRDRIARLHLVNPLISMRNIARHMRAEPLRSRLCRRPGRVLVYQMSLLRRDGKVVTIYVNARNGKQLPSDGAGK